MSHTQKRRLCCFLSGSFLALLLIVVSIPFRTKADALQIPSVSAQSAILLEAESGKVIYSHDSNRRLPMASTTKIMTALTALSLAAPEEIISVDAAAVGVEGSSVYLIAEEQLTLEQLLYALLLESANDAAAAIAIGICGSIEAFAEEMNRIADDMGLKDTHFVNPHGLDDEAHYTTAYELALITRKAMQNELIRTITSTRKTTIPHPGEIGARLLVNHNKLLRLYEDCIGVKTGFTKRSGRCLVSAAERDGVRLIAVTLNAPNDWQDHTSMLDYGFTQYRSVLLCRAEEFSSSLPVTGGKNGSVLLVNPSEVRVTLPVGHGPIKVTVEAQRFVYAPVQAGDLLGCAVYTCDTDGDGIAERIAETELRACSSVERQTTKKGFWQWLKSLFYR